MEEKTEYGSAYLKDLPIFFIIGMGRSGSTLLQNILDAHPSIISARESMFIMQGIEKFSDEREWNEKKINNLTKYFALDYKLTHYWNFSASRINRILKANVNEMTSYGDLCKAIILSHDSPYGHNSIKLIGNKNPYNTIFVNDLTKVFPNAKFIFLSRNPLDCIASHKQVFRNKKIARLTFAWKHFQKISESIQSQMGDQILKIEYESLVNDPESITQKICSFLNIEFHKDQLDFHQTFKEKNKFKVKSEIISGIHGELTKPIHTNKVGRYKSILTPNEIKLCTLILKKNYTLENEEYLNLKSFNPFLRIRIVFGWLSYYRHNLTVRFYYKSPYLIRIIFRKISLGNLAIKRLLGIKSSLGEKEIIEERNRTPRQ